MKTISITLLIVFGIALLGLAIIKFAKPKRVSGTTQKAGSTQETEVKRNHPKPE